MHTPSITVDPRVLWLLPPSSQRRPEWKHAVLTAQEKRQWTRVNLLHAIVTLVALWTVGVPTTASALPKNEIYRTYYNEPEFLTAVGEYDFTCHGRLKPLGQQTRYYVDDTLPCEEGPYLGPSCYQCLVIKGAAGCGPKKDPVYCPYIDCEPERVACPPWILWGLQ